MRIHDMFQKDIDRYINGVVSVSEEDTVAQELEEYVVTRELQRHFDDFFYAYERGLDHPERNVGVWIQGYFGSGKSHFLKMLSYLLENRRVNGRAAVDYFKDKFDNTMTFAAIERASRVNAETILFNIDEKGGGYKEGDTSETAVLRSIAHVFYDHLGFYGRDYKLARFEKMIDDRGKTAEFRAAYEDITGEPWVEDRESYDMFGEEVAEAANRAVGLSIQSVTDWADSTESVTVDFGELVSDIAEYAEKRERECGGTFRLLFMVDEMGQYLNGDVSRMLNLQTLVEQFCDKCGGRVWMVVTSQEAIDEMMSVVSMDFSKIQGRFSTRLSLSSSSVDEVIKRRVLDKNDTAHVLLANEYGKKSPVLKNLFTFEDSRGDLRGYASEREFVQSFPFVGYQFTLMPNVLKEVRKHGYQGKSLSTGERSMLSSYQEVAQSVEDGSETSLVPFWRFFDTLEKELDHGIKQVFERCRRAANENLGLMPEDLNVLKVLYLINYISDVKPTLGNVAILMVEDIEVDKVALRERVKASLDRLVKQNYVSRAGERYSFLTDEEQDVAREIRDEQIDPSAVVERVKTIVFDGLYNVRKYRKGANDYPFDRYVDGAIHGISSGGMKLDVVTMANSQYAEASDAELELASTGQAFVVLSTQSDYYEVLYGAAKIKKYIQTHSKEAMAASKCKIVEAKGQEMNEAESQARDLIADAILRSRTFVDGHKVRVSAANAKQKIDGVLDKLVDAVFTKAGLIGAPVQSDADIRNILAGRDQRALTGMGGGNDEAAKEVERFLDARARTHQPTAMGDIQRQYQARPYGWREIDVAAVIAQLIHDQKVVVSYGGEQLLASDTRMTNFLRKPNEVDKLSVKMRVALPQSLVSRSRSLLRELDSRRIVPTDEDGLVAAVKECMTERATHYGDLLCNSYSDLLGRYPGKESVVEAARLAKEILSHSADPESLLKAFVDNEDDLLDNAEDLESVESFFATQKPVFDDALTLVDSMNEERVYVEGDRPVQSALTEVKRIVESGDPYRSIPQLPTLCGNVREAYDAIVADKRASLLDKLGALRSSIQDYATREGESVEAVKDIARCAESEASSRAEALRAATTCSKLDALGAQMNAWYDAQLRKIDGAMTSTGGGKVTVEFNGGGVKVVSRSTVLPIRVLKTEQDINDYVDEFRATLLKELEGNDSIRLG